MTHASSLKTAAIAVFAAAITTAVSPSASAANVIANGGFEAGSGTDAANWQEVGIQPATRDNTNPNSGQWALKLDAVGTSGSGPNSVGLQNSIADGGQPSLQQLTDVDVSFQWAGDLGPGGVAFAVARILDGSGNIEADTGLQALPDNNNVYQLINLPTLSVPAFGAAPDDEYALFIEFSTAAGAFDGSFATGFVDDVNADGTFVPEPGSLALLGLGGLAMVARRRRRA